MLTELSIKEFAIIDEITITFNEGMTVLTGETGAGKSIIIDAVHLLLGERGSVDYVRHGAKQAELEGLFIFNDKSHPIFAEMEKVDIDMEDGMLVIQRKITSSGKSICRANGKLVTLSILKRLGNVIVDIHSQHETQSLLRQNNHLELLDLYIGKEMEQRKTKYVTVYSKLLEKKREYNNLSLNEQKLTHRLDLLQFQLNEIEQANLFENEDEKLEEERTQLVNFEKIYVAIHEAYNALYGDQKALDWLHIAKIALDDNRAYNTFIDEKATKLTDQYYILDEISSELRDYKEALHFDPQRLNELEARIDEINRLKRKYGSTVTEILKYKVKIEHEIEQLQNKDSHIEKLNEEIKELTKEAILKANSLHQLRKKASEQLEKEVQEELMDLYLENARFKINFSYNEEINDQKLHENGYDVIHFQISTNSGEPLKDLNKVASGGELSRIMLALKTIFSKHQKITTVIFDEIDTGVSGRVAQSIAEKMHQISTKSQVLCITHLPQVAAMADTHQYIEKQEQNDRTSTHVYELSEKQKIKEISRMMTGRELTESALDHAEELVHLAKQYKSKNKFSK